MGNEYDFDLGGMDRSDNRVLWIAMRLKTRNQRAVFDYVYDHPQCVLHEISENTGITKYSLMSLLRSMKEREIILYVEEEGQHRRHYYVNEAMVGQMLQVFRDRVARYLSEFGEDADPGER